MGIDKLIITSLSISGIVFTYWFFLRKDDKPVEIVGSEIDIKVSGGYKPKSVVVPHGKSTKINFLRKDPSSCLEEVVIGEFKIRKFLPLDQKVTLEILPQKKGEFVFSCGMGMFHGKLIVK